MNSMLRKEACSGSIRDLAHIPTQHCLSDCLTNSSGESRLNLSTSSENKEIVRCWDPSNFTKHSLSTRPPNQTGAEHSCTQGRHVFLPERFKDFSLTSFTKRVIPCDVCENFHGFWESRCYENERLHSQDPSTYSSVKMITQDMHMNGMNHFSQYPDLPFLLFVVAMSTSRLHWCLHGKQFVPGISSWRLRLTVLWRLSSQEERHHDSDLESESAENEWPHTKPKVSSVGFIISLFHWRVLQLFMEEWDFSKYMSNLSVCSLHCPENRWCPLLDSTYHNSIRRVLLRFMEALELSKFFSNLSVCYVHCSCGTWDRHETMCGDVRISRPWLDEGLWCAKILVMRSSPHLRLLRECSPWSRTMCVDGWQDSKTVAHHPRSMGSRAWPSSS